MKQNPKVLILSGIQIEPTNSGGQLRTQNLAKEFEKYSEEVVIFSFTGRRADYVAKVSSGWQTIGPKIREYVDRSQLNGFLQWVCYKLHLPPFWLTWSDTKNCPSLLKELISDADVLVSDFPFFFRFLESNSPQKLCVLNTHNIEAELYKSRLVQRYVEGVESRAYQAAKASFFCSEAEREHFGAADDASAFVIPNGIDEKLYAPVSASERTRLRRELNIPDDKSVFLFTAARHVPNLDAFGKLQAWAKENQALLKKLNALILVAGSVSESFVLEDYFRAEGRVESMFPYFHIADFALNPVETGSGTNVKMLEFMAAKLPILSTSFGTRGTNLTPEESYLPITFETLGEKIEQSLKIVDRERMSELAYQQNQNLVSMKFAFSKFAEAYLVRN